MYRDRIHFLFLNVGHFLDHMFTLIFATVAALALTREWGLSYGDLLKYATPGFFAFGLFSLPAGWLADKWSREGMVAVFFVGIGLSSIATGDGADAAAGRHRAVLHRRVRRDLSSGRARHRHAALEEHRHAARGERRVGQSRRCQCRPHHRLFHRPRRLARWPSSCPAYSPSWWALSTQRTSGRPSCRDTAKRPRRLPPADRLRRITRRC